jgi:hypothetical protein
MAHLADALGVGMTRVWQIVGRLELGRIQREAEPADAICAAESS